MVFDWLTYGLLVWALVAVLNATAFRRDPAGKAASWTLTFTMFFVNLVAMTALQHLRYQVLSQDLGLEIKPKGPVDAIGAFTFSWLFYSLLRKRSKTQSTPIAHTPTEASPSFEVSEKASTSSFAPTIASVPKILESTSPADDRSGVPEEQFWSVALAEFEGSSRRTGLWAMAFSEAQGNEAVAKATYLRIRATELELERRVTEHQAAKDAASRVEHERERIWARLTPLQHEIQQNIAHVESGDGASFAAFVKLIRLLNGTAEWRVFGLIFAEWVVTFEGKRFVFPTDEQLKAWAAAEVLPLARIRLLSAESEISSRLS